MRPPLRHILVLVLGPQLRGEPRERLFLRQLFPLNLLPHDLPYPVDLRGGDDGIVMRKTRGQSLILNLTA